MRLSLSDVNILLALLYRNHADHQAAAQWYGNLYGERVGVCRYVQLSLMRLLGNSAILGANAVPASEAWNMISSLLEDERMEFVPEPPGLDSVLPQLLTYRVPTTKLINDAYLAAFAIASNRTLVTVDKGFRQFRGLQVEFPLSPK